MLFTVVLVRALARWRATTAFERLQLTPVYVCALLTFLLVTVARAGVGEAAWWAAFVSTGLMPFAFLGGLLRSHVEHLDAELRESLEELRASRARIVEAGDAERRRLERDLHDGAQARLVGAVAPARDRAPSRGRQRRARGDARPGPRGAPDRAHRAARAGPRDPPAVLTDRGLEPALHALVDRATVPVTVTAEGERLPAPVEAAAYFVVSEALQNVAKYAHAREADVSVRRCAGGSWSTSATTGSAGPTPRAARACAG